MQVDRFHNYQSVIDRHLQHEDLDDKSKLAIESINGYDSKFHKKIRWHSTKLTQSRVIRHTNRNGYTYHGRPDLRRIPRDDFIDDDGFYVRMNNSEYALAKIYEILAEHDVVQHIRDLKEDGLVSEVDLAVLN